MAKMALNASCKYTLVGLFTLFVFLAYPIVLPVYESLIMLFDFLKFSFV